MFGGFVVKEARHKNQTNSLSIMKDSFKNDPRILMRLAKEGDKEAFGRLYELYFVPVFRYVYFRVRNKEETQDLVQTVFLKAFKAVSGFREMGKPPLAYFFAIAMNAVKDHWKKKKELALDLDEVLNKVADDNQHLQEKIEKELNSEILQKAIARLSEEQQKVITLKFISGLSNKEIAEIISKTEEAVRQIQCRGIKALREYLKDSEIL